MRAEVPFTRLLPTENNVRRAYQRIEQLAVSIAEHGLLQNLVVVERPDGCFEVRAGERRRRAIELLRLSAEEQEKRFKKILGAWPDDKLVPVLVVPEYESEAANLIENVHREELYPWDLGRRLAEWNDAGFDQLWIADRVGRGITWVNSHMCIGRYLSPRVSSALEKLGKHSLKFEQILKIARVYDQITLEPEHEKQVELFERLLGSPREPKPRINRSDLVMNRLKSLQKLGGIPGHAKPYVKAVCDYLLSQERHARIKFNWE